VEIAIRTGSEYLVHISGVFWNTSLKQTKIKLEAINSGQDFTCCPSQRRLLVARDKEGKSTHLQSIIQTFLTWQNDGPDRSVVCWITYHTDEKTRAAVTADYCLTFTKIV